MLYTHAAAALIAALIAGSTAWTVRAWKADADAANIVAGLHAAVEAQRAGADAAAERFEAERARLAGRRQIITREVDRVVERPIYRDGVCLDADGLRLVAAAASGALNPGELAASVPAAGAAP